MLYMTITHAIYDYYLLLLLSSRVTDLLHALSLTVWELTPSDQYQFYTDFMTLDTLTVFLNHTDINVIYSTLKVG